MTDKNNLIDIVRDGILPAKTDTVPFVPKADIMPPAADRFIDTVDRQFQATYEMLLNSARVLEAKAAELRRRADRIDSDRNYAREYVHSLVSYEDECRNVALSLSLIEVKEGV